MIPKCFRVLWVLALFVSAQATETTTLPKLVATLDKNPKASTEILRLERDWIGDITDEDGAVTHLRLEKGQIFMGEVMLLRTAPNGSYCGGDAPVYVKVVPTDGELRSCGTVAAIKKLLGPGQPGIDGWGDGKEMYGSHSWICCGLAAENRLNYISVFALTIFNQRAKDPIRIRSLGISRGELRPAALNDPAEAKLYLSGAEMFAAGEKAKADSRQGYPQPLRDLVKVDEDPNDSDLKKLSAAVQKIRERPDPRLFRQLVQEMHEGTLKIRGLLEDILLNDFGTLKLKPWQAEQEAIAINACIDALPLANDLARGNLVEILLTANGGGKIEIEDKYGGESVEVTRNKDGGHFLTISGSAHTLSVEAAQKELRRRYADARVRQRGGNQDKN